jgi:hypothetical protein
MDLRVGCMALVIVTLTPACSRGLNRRIDCNRALQLRLGQTAAEVRTLIGEPRFAGEARSVWRDGSPRTDYEFIYSGEGDVLLGTRDEMSVSFLDNSLVEVSAYRMRVYVGDHDKGTTALMLGSRDYGDRTPPFHTVGPAFKEVFQCPADFSTDLTGTDWTFER